jgi:tRNA threonylcarbamoyladenosine biosynthesis protein TsaE
MDEAQYGSPQAPEATLRVRSGSVEDTAQVARVLAGRLIEGDVVLLCGQLAAGKTTFVKAVAAALGSSDVVTSPTFTLAQFYASAAGPVLHIDAYRLDGVEEYRDLGLDEYVESSVTFVEWGDRVAAEFAAPLVVEFRVDGSGDGEREIVFTAAGRRWAEVLPGLRRELDGMRA